MIPPLRDCWTIKRQNPSRDLTFTHALEKIEKSQNVVFHLFAQKRPLNGLAPNLACGVGPLTLSPESIFINCFNGFDSVEGRNFFPLTGGVTAYDDCLSDWGLLYVEMAVRW